MLTQERLKELFIYNPDTGIVTRRISTSSRSMVGTVCGCKKKDGYLQVNINKKSYPLHRIIVMYMTGKFPNECTDHINHVRDDNRWVNIREVTYLENNRNASLHAKNTSGFTGVSWNKNESKWESRIKVSGVRLSLGLYENKSDAIIARKEANIKYEFHKNHGLSYA